MHISEYTNTFGVAKNLMFIEIYGCIVILYVLLTDLTLKKTKKSKHKCAFCYYLQVLTIRHEQCGMISETNYLSLYIVSLNLIISLVCRLTMERVCLNFVKRCLYD